MSFKKEDIALRYFQDKISKTEWCLVYEDQPAAVLHRICSFFLFCGLTSLSLMFLDYYKTDGDFSLPLFKKLIDDAVEVSF